jgi:signal transduction histidine kinase/DNA-binding NarL/FixJ family response regulator/HPt (histidine-containing phosphotransfer) domain-containing protein
MNITKNEILNFGKAYTLLKVSFIVLNKNFYIDYLNDTAKEVLQWDNNSDSVGQLFFKVWADAELLPLLDATGKIISKNPIKIADYYLEWERVHATVEEKNYLLLIGKDVTEREIMYQSMEKACEDILGITYNKRFPAPYYINEVYNYLNGIINQIPCYVYWKNRSLQYIGCNQMAANFLKLNSAEEIIGKTDFDIFSNWELAKEYRTTDEHIFSSGKAVINQPGELINNEGEVIHTLVSKIPISNQVGDIMGLAGISVDVTDLKNAQSSAELANQVKTEFIANMSHDIRTPLTGVIGMSKILEDSVHEERQKQYAHWLAESGKQLLHMLNGILDVVSADNVNEFDLHEEPFNLCEVVHDIEHLEYPSALIKGIELVTYVDESIPHCLVSDPTKIHRILLNLLGNAIKFTQGGRVEINVQLLEQNNTHALIQFLISDTGIGIPAELHDKVFDRFYRITPSDKGTYSGHGVGLHIAQSYVNLLGGEILLRSKPGEGTTFYFDLSLKIGGGLFKTASPDVLEPLTRVLPSAVSLPSYGVSKAVEAPKYAPNLLLVEDNKIALFTLENLIAQAKFRFTSVIDGEAAFHLVEANKFDLIITDLGLPGLSGIELTRKIRAFEKENLMPAIPIIGLTAHSEEKIKRGCLKAGMNDVFTKPMTTDVLGKIKKVYFSAKHFSFSSNDASESANELGIFGSAMSTTTDDLFKLDEFSALDVQSALPSLAGDVALLKSILKSMLEQQIPADVYELEKAYAMDDWYAIEELAHRMKSGFIYCGAIKLVHACQYIERYNKAGHTQLLEPLYKQLLKVIDETRSSMSEWLLLN